MKKLSAAIRLDRANRLVIIAAGITIILLIWASIAEVEETTRIQGLVIARDRTQIIQSAIDGVVNDIAVEEGQKVKTGQILASLERTQAEAAQNDSFGKVAALEASLARLQAEVLGSPLAFPASVMSYPHFVSNQMELYRRRKSALESELATLKENLGLAREELDLTQPLVASGDVGRIEVIRLQRQVAELKGQISFRRNKFFQEAQQEMTKVEEELSTQKQILAERSFMVDKLDVRSPVDGSVKKIQVTTKGAKVRPGEVIMELLPTSSKLIVEGKLKTSDVGFVRPGMQATVKLDAFDYSIYGVLMGKVSYISPDAITEQTPQGEMIYYRVQIRLDEKVGLHRHGILISAQPGMTATMDIRTGTKTVLSYLTKPVIKVFGESLGER